MMMTDDRPSARRTTTRTAPEAPIILQETIWRTVKATELIWRFFEMDSSILEMPRNGFRTAWVQMGRTANEHRYKDERSTWKHTAIGGWFSQAQDMP
jgi:hypothetical protein